MNNSNNFTDINAFITWVESQRRFSKKTSLDKMRFLMELFNHPEKKFLSIHITGTNGKGSSVAMLRSIYQTGGYHVATFTSPYVVCFNERICFDGKYISDLDLLYYGNLIVSKYDLIINKGYELPTFFEFITLLAFLYFSNLNNLDLAIIEVGMGGRLDATNVINPLVGAITNVTKEHIEQLGNTLEKITNEKLGIIKNNVPLVTSEKKVRLLAQMQNHCILNGVDFIKVHYDAIKIISSDLNGSYFSYKDYKNIFIPLAGTHQIENACLCIEIVEYMNKLAIEKKSNLTISSKYLYEGFKNCFWPARMEKVSTNPLIYLDGGHNIDCMKRICAFIKKLNIKFKRVVVAISSDKELDKMISLLDETFDEIIFTNYTYKRSAKGEYLYNLSNSNRKILIDNVCEAVNYCFTHKCEFTLFTGSLYLVSEVRPIIINLQNK